MAGPLPLSRPPFPIFNSRNLPPTRQLIPTLILKGRPLQTIRISPGTPAANPPLLHTPSPGPPYPHRPSDNDCTSPAATHGTYLVYLSPIPDLTETSPVCVATCQARSTQCWCRHCAVLHNDPCVACPTYRRHVPADDARPILITTSGTANFDSIIASLRYKRQNPVYNGSCVEPSANGDTIPLPCTCPPLLCRLSRGALELADSPLTVDVLPVNRHHRAAGAASLNLSDYSRQFTALYSIPITQVNDIRLRCLMGTGAEEQTTLHWHLRAPSKHNL